ncbi:Vacuolar H+-ATPase V1 sector, subunit C [Pseudoloma neurophilia]|uniref:V-type proton ATPase subunit C n=1 Tax=Pseudoloma neurophilia TaxID=146866 RepID=A0A0R0M0C0_9MICR|nr:Vacuolar H+-ATPase V1 sector, subunit C [Pseudoloma neurophilia]
MQLDNSKSLTLISLPVVSYDQALALHAHLNSSNIFFKKLNVPLNTWASFGGMIELTESLQNIMINTKELLVQVSLIFKELLQNEKYNQTDFQKVVDAHNLNQNMEINNFDTDCLDITHYFSDFTWPEKYNDLSLIDLINSYESDLNLLKRNFTKRKEEFQKKKEVNINHEKRLHGNLIEKGLEVILNETKYFDTKECENLSGNRSMFSLKTEDHNDKCSENLECTEDHECTEDQGTVNHEECKESDCKEFQNEDRYENQNEDQNEEDGDKIEESSFLFDLFVVKKIADEKNNENLLKVAQVCKEGTTELVHFIGLVKRKEEIVSFCKEHDWNIKKYQKYKQSDQFDIYEKNFLNFLNIYFLENINLFIIIKLTKLYIDSILKYGLPVNYIFFLVDIKSEKKFKKLLEKFQFKETFEWKNMPKEEICTHLDMIIDSHE